MSDTTNDIPDDVQLEVERRILGFTEFLNGRFSNIKFQDQHAFCILILSALDREGKPIFKPVQPEVHTDTENRIAHAVEVITDPDAEITLDCEMPTYEESAMQKVSDK